MKAIRVACAPVIGRSIERIETAEILHDDGEWDDWRDLPIRIYCSDQTLLSVSWSRIDDLWLSYDKSLPFEVDDATTRWKSNGVEQISAANGETILGVWLGRGKFSSGSSEIEVWTRLIFDLGGKWLEVFNGLDENRYDLHKVKPDGEILLCT